MTGFFTTYQINFWERILLPGIIATFKMLIITTLCSVAIGAIIAGLLVITNKGGVLENRWIYGGLSFLVNIIRSFPIIILIVSLMPVTKAIVGTAIGVKAALVPLTISATAFISKLIESSLQEVDRDLVKAMRSFGITDLQLMLHVIFVEAIPSIVSGIIISMVNILGATAIAGVVGAGGIGSIALTYGYQSYNKPVMYLTVAMLVALVQLIQWTGDIVYRKLKA